MFEFLNWGIFEFSGSRTAPPGPPPRPWAPAPSAPVQGRQLGWDFKHSKIQTFPGSIFWMFENLRFLSLRRGPGPGFQKFKHSRGSIFECLNVWKSASPGPPPRPGAPAQSAPVQGRQLGRDFKNSNIQTFPGAIFWMFEFLKFSPGPFFECLIFETGRAGVGH